jgi:hypothetical protein
MYKFKHILGYDCYFMIGIYYSYYVSFLHSHYNFLSFSNSFPVLLHPQIVSLLFDAVVGNNEVTIS